jgi:hypothetical protein
MKAEVLHARHPFRTGDKSMSYSSRYLGSMHRLSISRSLRERDGQGVWI